MEKVMKRIGIILFSVLVLLSLGGACNKSTPTDKELTEAEKEVKALQGMVLDAEGHIVFDKSTTGDLYLIGVESIEDATALAALYAGSGFTGEDYTRSLPEGKGTVQVTQGLGRLYYTVQFDVTGIPPFTLKIMKASKGSVGTGYSGTYQKCSICGFTWRSASSICPMTSKHGK